MERMKKMRKMLGLGRKKKARQEEEGAPPPPEPQSRSGAATAGAYRVRSRELGPLHRAAAEGDLGRLRQLLTQKQDPDQRDRGGRTPLHLACANGCTEIVALLVDHKCQLNIYDGDKRSPLMKAVQCQQELCAIYLLEHGADPNFVDVYSNTALHFAALNSSISIAKHLLDHNANIEAQNTDGSTPLIVAVVENNREMVEFLLKKGASVHATDNAGRTPLLIATSNKKRDLTHVLLSYGSDVSHKDDSGWSAQDYAMLSDDPILLQYIAEYSKQKNGSGKSDDQNVFSVLNVPDRTGDAGITLGAPATNIEVLEDHSSGDSVRDSGKTDDTWPSSEEEELDFSVKKPQKPSLARLMSVSQQFKTNVDEKSSLFRSELVVDSQRNSSISDAGGVNESFSRPLFHVQSFPQPAHSSPGSFSTQCQMASRLSPKQEGSFEEEEDEEEEEEEEDGKNPSFMAKNLNCHAISLNQISSQDDSVQKASLRLGADEEEDKEKAPESPWDSEGVSESPRKPAVDSSPASPAKIKTLMPAVAEEPCDRSSANAKPEMAKMNLEHEAASSPLSQQDQTRGKQKSDLMEELGLDDADDIEDASDWDSASVSQSLPCVNTFNIFSWGECSTPAQLPMSNASPRTSIPARVDDTPVTETREAAKGPSCSKQNAEELEHGDAKVEEEKRKQELAETKKAENTEKAAANVEEKMEQRPSADENHPLATRDERKSAVGEDQGTDVVSSSDGEELVPVPHKGNNPTAHAKGRRKREKKRRISKPKFGQQTVDKRHQPQDESSLSEASLEDEKQPEKMVNRRNKICKAMDITNNCEDLTPSSDTATEDIESPTSVYGEAMMLIEQLTLDSKADAVSLFKIQNIFHGYERVIEREKGRSTQLLGKVKKLENEKKDQQRILDEVREAKCMLDHQTVEQESDISSLKFSLKQEEEKRTSVEMQYEKTQEQLRKKEEQCCKQVEEKQQLEIMLRGLEVELRTLKNRLAQVEEERDETQRQLSQEQKARALQEGVLNTHLWRQKEWEEESKKAAAKHYEMSEHHNQEEELMQQNQAFQEELAVLRAELDRLRIHHEEKDSRYLEENEALKEKIEDLKKELKLNEEALTQTIFQYNGQINVSKTEAAVLASKLEHTKENKERLELELDSFRARVSAAIQELEQSQVSRKDLELTLRREREEWLRSKDQLSREVGALQEANGSLSQQLGRAESKINSLENELQLATHGLREKSLLFEGVRRDLDQAQGRAKELEHALDVEKEQRNKQVIKQDSLQERLAQLQSENLLLRQQLEDVQNKGVLKEKVVTDVQEKFSDIFGKLQADTEKQLRMVEERNQELVAKCHDFREQVLKYEAEKADREGTVRQLQQELADSLKKQSMSEASLEVSTRYRSDLEEDKQQLQKEIDRIKSKLQESEEQYLQSERRIHDLRNALDSKEREASVTSQKLHDLLAASSGANNAIKQLEGHIQRLEVENARLEATTTQQSHRIEILQKDLQDSLSVHSRLEELITGLQTAKINLEEELHQQAQKQTTLSAMAQDTHSLWEEELKSRSKLGIRLSELDREKAELMAQCENERKKVKKLAELKRSVELRLDQEMKRNHELQKEYNGIKKLAKVTKRKLKEYESSESSWRDMKTKYSENEVEIGKLRKKVDELSYQLEAESTRCTRLELANDELRRELSSMKTLRRNYEELQKSKQRLEEEMAGLQTPGPGRPFDLSQVEQYKRDVEERAKQEVIQKLEEVNLFLQTQAASQDTLEQIRATNQASLRNQLEKRIQDLESELSKLKRCEQEGRLQKELAQSELERCKSLYSEELKTRKTLGRKLDRAQEKLAEANAKLFHERHRSKSLLASSFLSGSLSAGPMRETVPLGNLGGGSLAFGRPLSLGSGFVGPSGSPLASKSRVEAYLAKMQMELETTINKELDQAKAELDAASARVSPIGSLDGSSKNLNPEPDQVAKAAQEYLDVLKKNYMI
nr:ankyrin repeat domain-containing protein 26-like isoform X9 [Pogona vitticeps]